MNMTLSYAKIGSKKYFGCKISRIFILISILTENKQMFDTGPGACTDGNTLPCSQNLLPLPQPNFLRCIQYKHSLKLSMERKHSLLFEDDIRPNIIL